MRNTTDQLASFQVQAIEEKDVLPYCKDMLVDQHLTTLDSDDGTRLDFFIARSLSCGQRTAKRLIANGGVTVNGKNKPAHYKLAAGMEIVVINAPTKSPGLESACALYSGVVPVAKNADYAVFYKPGGLHTAKIAGSASASLEGMLSCHTPPLVLLSRLDRDTSGLVPAAFSPNAAKQFKEMEAAAQVRKEYVTLVRGSLHQPLLLQNTLDTNNRKTTRVLDTFSEDATRFTEIRPLPLPAPVENATLAVATIMRGARHQIRAHLAFAGHPIIGDDLYGENDFTGPLYLHHARLTFPGLTAFAPPPWLPDFLEQML